MKLKLCNYARLEIRYCLVSFFAEIKIFRFWSKSMDYRLECLSHELSCDVPPSRAEHQQQLHGGLVRPPVGGVWEGGSCDALDELTANHLALGCSTLEVKTLQAQLLSVEDSGGPAHTDTMNPPHTLTPSHPHRAGSLQRVAADADQ